MSDKMFNKDIITKAEDTFNLADEIISKSYLSKAEQYPLVPVSKIPDIDEINKKVRFFEIQRIVLKKNENIRDKLVSVFNAVGNTGASLLFYIAGEQDRVSISIGVRNTDPARIAMSHNVLKSSFAGNFPGSVLSVIPKDNLEDRILCSMKSANNRTVIGISDIPGLRADEETDKRDFIQGIEKFIDAMQGQRYQLFLIADPISPEDLKIHRRAMENIYSCLVPYSAQQETLGRNEMVSVNESVSEGFTDSVSRSIGESVSHTTGTSKSHTETKGLNLGWNSGWNLGIPFVGQNWGQNWGMNESNSDTAGYNESYTKVKNVTDINAKSKTVTGTRGVGYQVGYNTGVQIQFENHSVKKMMERIDKFLEYYDTCSDLGMWNTSMYCIADNSTSHVAASIFRSLLRGMNSSLESKGITIWSDEEKVRQVLNSFRNFEHPRFKYNEKLSLTPGTLISSAELAIYAGLPNHSVPGIPVVECAEFGRVVSSYEFDKNKSMELGSIWHMNQAEKLPVNLDFKSLASHTFITGSTGSGKSNTIYQIISKAVSPERHFLVIEPAKGEYKNIFGGMARVNVYGTNPSLTPLLRINPFSFPKDIHILEHLDRLIEIFNVCWPMYAAMPAVLKEAVEKSYEDCGWNLTESTNEYGDDFYPTFADITGNIRTIIDSSEYDSENKGAYKGALVTRLKSLSNGINGLVFTKDEISNKELFDENVIVDLSRVGSVETKSLIMGLLILKLQEYRMTSGEMNRELKHVTVLEEAHNLLKRTSTEQNPENGNLMGKSVEMIANAIAEMRTYGEGFIIADQAPGLLDMSVIRNTNTKIIMRLPDQGDRELVGKAANLNDEQIKELAKLPCGVAAVYQNEWIEPVLCKVNCHEKRFSYVRSNLEKTDNCMNKDIRISMAQFLNTGKSDEKLEENVRKSSLRDSTKVKFLRLKKNMKTLHNISKYASVISELFPELRICFINSYRKPADFNKCTNEVCRAIIDEIGSDDEKLRNFIYQCIVTDYLLNELNDVEMLENWKKSVTRGCK